MCVKPAMIFGISLVFSFLTMRPAAATDALDTIDALHDAHQMRHADAPMLARALTQAREETLAMHTHLHAVRKWRPVPFHVELNPLLWELGHVGWFEEWWIARNSQRDKGAGCDPDAPRSESLLQGSDALYNSSKVPHETRWGLRLPDIDETMDYLANVREQSLHLLQTAQSSDDALYFYRLALFHEDMHREALIYMTQALGNDLPILDNLCQSSPAIINTELRISGTVYEMGSSNKGFAFDNELQANETHLSDYCIDAQVLRWEQYLPFIDAGGYQNRQLWSAAGWRWVCSQHHEFPRYLKRSGKAWQRLQSGQWQPLDFNSPAMNLTYYEAEAWCRWAKRRLPTEAEWEYAAKHEKDFAWGTVWEWTASAFAPYAGFVAHPYRDYSAPWFDGRPVLRGASFATTPRMKHPHYRNYYTPERNDIFAGFRTCAL